MHCVVCTLQARSQDLKKGGLFWKSEKTAYDLDPNFHCSWIRITRFVRKLRRNFSENSEIRTLFQPKSMWSQKKKGLHRNWDGFSAKIGNSNAFSRRITTCTSQFRHPISFGGGGAVFIFSPKIGLKHTKNVRFCILYRSMGGGGGGGAEPPIWLCCWYYTKDSNF